MTYLRRLSLLLVALLPLATATAQEAPGGAALLVADEVFLTGDGRLVARGNVEAIHEGRRLRAGAITYASGDETLSVEGPITLEEGENILILANSAQIDRDLRDGILKGARIVLDDQVQLAANQMNRAGGRYTQLYKVAVTSCRICREGNTPLWQIRARRVVHDQKERQLYFDDAQFRILDVPVFYLPRLRLPDPTLERATGFLVPSVHSSSELGFGVKLPYFVKLGDHRDVTLTPFLATKTRSLGLRYRQAFRQGDIEVNTAVSDDDAGNRSVRAYMFVEGRFDLPRDFKLVFDIETVNDDTYLEDYRITAKDRLDSEISVERAERDALIRGAITHFKTLRRGESNATLPTVVGDAEYERRFFPRRLGGELRFSTEALSYYRKSDQSTDGPDFDRFADGRDVTRLTAGLHWYRNWILRPGIRTQFRTGVDIDSFRVDQIGGTALSEATEVTPSAALRFDMPLIKTTATGATHILRPVVQLSWAGGHNPDVPNDESTRVDFDEGNLFALSRFTGADRRERGAALAYGLTWARHDPRGWKTALTFGQVLRDRRLTESDGSSSFTDASGLEERYSDYLVAGQLKAPNGISLTARGVFDDLFDATKAEARASWTNDRANIGAAFIWQQDDPAEERGRTNSEWEVEGSYRLSRHWTGSAEWRYDVVDDRSVEAGLGIAYTNECVEVELSASRRFTSSINVDPSTDISLTVGIRGFSTKTEDKSYVRTCRK